MTAPTTNNSTLFIANLGHGSTEDELSLIFNGSVLPSVFFHIFPNLFIILKFNLLIHKIEKTVIRDLEHGPRSFGLFSSNGKALIGPKKNENLAQGNCLQKSPKN